MGGRNVATVVILAVSLSVHLAAGQASGEARYELTQVARGSIYPRDLNNRGQAVYDTYTWPWLVGSPECYLWDRGSRAVLPALAGDESCSAAAINNAGCAVGTSDSWNLLGRQAVLWRNGQAVGLGTLPGDVASRADDINNRGQVVGSSWGVVEDSTWGSELVLPGPRRAFLWQRGQMTELGTLGGSFSAAYAINNAGRVVGSSGTADGAEHAFLWERGEMIDLGTLPGFSRSSARGINERGQVIGEVYDLGPIGAIGTHGPQPFLWENGTMEELGLLDGFKSGSANDINSRGQVVGSSSKMEVPDIWLRPLTHACLWEDGQVHDLNDLIDPDAGVELGYAAAINDAGQILAVERDLSGPMRPRWVRAFLLTPVGQGAGMAGSAGDPGVALPVPEPGVLALLLAGAAAMGRHRRRTR